MARDIKFRAWFRPTDEYKADYVDRYGKELPDLEVEYYTEEVFLDDSWVNTDNYKSIIFEQYTGLKDKNGKEIYEGDILGDEWGNGYISWCNKCKQFQYHISGECMACGGDVQWYELVVDDGKLEVIGNIHENPSLVEIDHVKKMEDEKDGE